MPVVAIGVGAYIVGLLLGYGDMLFLGGLIAGLALARGLVASERIAVAAALILAAGLVTARVTVDDDAHCLEALQHRKIWRAVLDQSIRPGGFVLAHALECHAELSLSVNHGRGTAGDVVLVVGEAVRSASHGLVVQHAS